MSVVSETVADMAVILGHARISTTGQELGAQLATLAAAGVGDDRIYTDNLSEAANTARPAPSRTT